MPKEQKDDNLDNNFRFSKKRIGPNWTRENIDEQYPDEEEELPDGFHVEKPLFLID